MEPDKTVLAQNQNRPACTPALEKFLASLSIEPQDLSGDTLLAGSPRAQIATLNVPAIGGIPLFARIGRGGMGAVYYGVHPRLKKEVAVKIMTLDTKESPDSVERFFREAQIAANLQSPNLVSVLDVNEENNLFYIVMEFVSGMTAGAFVKRVIHGGRIGLDELSALDICIAATEGLAHAHDAGIIHRDIKPENIMVPFDKAGRLVLNKSKLADLGLARTQDGHSNQSLSADNVCGTLGYMSPEQTRSSRLTKKPADVFSMGATLYALLTGHAPFTGSSPVEIILATVQSFPKAITKYRGDISAATLALIERSLSKNDSERPADANALLAEMRDCRQSAAQPARGTAIIERTVIAAHTKPKPELDQDTVLKTFKYTVPPHEKKAQAPLVRPSGAQRTMKTAPARIPSARRPAEKSSIGWLVGAAAIVVVALALWVFRPPRIAEQPIPAATNVAATHEAKPILPALASDQAAFNAEVAKLPPAEQVKKVMARLMDLNPGFDGANTFKEKDGHVDSLDFSTLKVSDVSPIDALRQLTVLKMHVDWELNHKFGALHDVGPVRNLINLVDLDIGINPIKGFEPLANLKLTALTCRGANATTADLAYLQGMPLNHLQLDGSVEITSLAGLKGLPLKHLSLWGCVNVRDIQPLANLTIEDLNIKNTGIKDFSPLKAMARLKKVFCDYIPERDYAILKSIKTLETVNGKSIADLPPP